MLLSECTPTDVFVLFCFLFLFFVLFVLFFVFVFVLFLFCLFFVVLSFVNTIEFEIDSYQCVEEDIH